MSADDYSCAVMDCGERAVAVEQTANPTAFFGYCTRHLTEPVTSFPAPLNRRGIVWLHPPEGWIEPTDPETALRGETGLSYGESLWLWDSSNDDFDRYTVAEFRPGDWYTNPDATVAPEIVLYADGDPRWPLTLDLGRFTRNGWHTVCPWPECGTLVHSSNVGRYDNRLDSNRRLLCAEHSTETRGIDYEAETP